MAKTKIVTHSAGFHADDVFAVATLALLLGDDIEVIRSRDPEVVATGDYVVDVGGVYDPSTNRFDHHQRGGAGTRDNGIPYAAFGLVWKQFGEQVAGSLEVAQRVHERLVQAIDAYDNGFPLFTLSEQKVSPFFVQDVVGLFEPAYGEIKARDEGFFEAVTFAKNILRRLIAFAQAEQTVARHVADAYERSKDKRVIVFEEGFIADRVFLALTLGHYADTRLFVRQHEDGRWQVVTVANPPLFYDNRMLLPEPWGGLSGAELAQVSGVPDATFCHQERFMAVAQSKEGALKLAEIAVSHSQ